jgi:hypothetical protein
MSVSRAKSGIRARMFTEDWIVPPNNHVVGAANYESTIRQVQGYDIIKTAVLNNTQGRLRVFQSWSASGPWVVVLGALTSADPVSTLQVADMEVPVTRKFAKIIFVGTLGVDFELGSYLIPR